MTTQETLSATEMLDGPDAGWRWQLLRDQVTAVLFDGVAGVIGYAQTREIASRTVLDLKAASIAAVESERF